MKPSNGYSFVRRDVITINAGSRQAQELRRGDDPEQRPPPV